MMMMSARQMVGARSFVIGRRIVMMIGMLVVTVMHRVERKITDIAMVVRDHEGRAVLDLVGRLRRHRRCIGDHQRDAERRDQTVEKGSRTDHPKACNWEAASWQPGGADISAELKERA